MQNEAHGHRRNEDWICLASARSRKGHRALGLGLSCTCTLMHGSRWVGVQDAGHGRCMAMASARRLRQEASARSPFSLATMLVFLSRCKFCSLCSLGFFSPLAAEYSLFLLPYLSWCRSAAMPVPCQWPCLMFVFVPSCSVACAIGIWGWLSDV